jgi:phosphatidylglycerophosphatase A
VRRLAIALATVGGVGHAPVASGTAGTLVALPLMAPLAALRDASLVGYLACLLVVIGIAVWSAGEAEEILGGADHRTIVVDEVAGMLLAGAFIPGSWLAVGIAFVLFRLFDVVKPFPANVFDGQMEGGIGVVGDDLVAGVYAGLLTWVVLKWL